MAFYQTVQELTFLDIVKEHMDERILHSRVLVITKLENETESYHLASNLSMQKLLIFAMCHNVG